MGARGIIVDLLLESPITVGYSLLLAMNLIVSFNFLFFLMQYYDQDYQIKQ